MALKCIGLFVARFPPHGFITVQDKEDAAVILGCSVAEIGVRGIL